MPFKNEEKFLRETLSSIINQSQKEWELWCVDDHSTDSSSQIIKEYELADSRVKYTLNSGNGVIQALQSGYSLCSGDFITRMDADDVMPSKKLERLKALLQKNGKGYIATGKVKYFNALGAGFIQYQNWLNNLVDHKRHWAEIYKECVIASPNWMMSREDFEKIGGFNSEVYPEDYDLIFRCYASQIKVLSTTEVTHLWRDHEQRASRTSELYSDNSFVNLKIKYFFKCSRYDEKRLVLWGAGKKGKSISKLLIERGVEFTWLTNNPKKQGIDIYGVKLQSDEMFFDNSQWILAVSSPNDLRIKELELSENGLVLGLDYFVFV